MAPWRWSSPPRTGHRPKSAHHLRTKGKPQEGTGMGWGRSVGVPGSFAGSTRAGRSAGTIEAGRAGCEGADARVRTRGPAGCFRRTGARTRALGTRVSRGMNHRGFSPADQYERFDVPSNQECASAVAGHPDGCPAVGAPRPRSPASRAARPRAPRRAQGDRARRSSQESEPRAAKVQGHQGVWWTNRTHKPGRYQSPDNQARIASVGRGSTRKCQRRAKNQGNRGWFLLECGFAS